MSTPAFPVATILGYPRIGPRRELKRAVEAFWSGAIDAEELERRAADLRRATRERLAELGLGRTDSAIPESFSWYDHVLDTALTVGALPGRFGPLTDAEGHVALAGLFTVARGSEDQPPLEMTKWFDSNYHYLVPEIDESTPFSAGPDRLVRWFEEALADGVRTRPVLVGPVTLLALSKPAPGAAPGFRPIDRLDDALAAYRTVLARAKAAGVDWLQLDEPALVVETLDLDRAELLAAAERAYRELGDLTERPALFVAAPYGSLDDALAPLAESAVEAIGLDLHRGDVPAPDAALAASLAGKTLVGGVIDGRNIWAA
ncbi:MAG: 5-methyltetrahydropteroyltriglutamate--homocysteine methyltransferase, partial [Microbacteriaceae bacterium]|nr:5-methyltetrahydropteroyltriglutamate--homocysteine methyltransferase [Microbacteriaceae bacterium]